MGRFRRRKPAVAWLPHVEHSDNEIDGYWLGANVIPADGSFNTVIYALTVDYPAEAIRTGSADTPTMADFEAGAYRLRRIVGKCFGGVTQNITANQVTYPTNVLWGVGFMVLKVDPSTGQPLRTAPSEYSPLHIDATRDPWIWRRTWLLTNQFGHETNGSLLGWSQAPTYNGDYGSAVDGPHIDQKTARRVSAEERLFFISTAVNIGDAATAAGELRWVLDYRLLGSLLRSSGNRRNASR